MTTIITYEQMKEFYRQFKNNPQGDNVSRCIQELNFMKSLIEFAKKQGLNKDVFEYKKIQEETANKLRDMGYKITIEE